MIGIQGVSVIRNYAMYVNETNVFHADTSLSSFLEKGYEGMKLSYPKYFKMDHMAQAGVLATEALLRQCSVTNVPEKNVAVIFTNAHASLDADQRYYESMQQTPSPALFVYTLPNIVVGEISIKFGWKGEQSFFIMPRFDPDFLVQYATLVLEQTPMEACLMGWVDVYQEHHDVFLYLIQKGVPGLYPHTPETLHTLYHSERYGTINS
jgi:hypothetical protein